MSKRCVMITGSKGFVGQNITMTILNEHQDEFLLVDFVDPATGQAPDIRDALAVNRTILHRKPDFLIHLAAIAAPRSAQDDPSGAWAVNMMGTLNLAQAILQHSRHTRMIWSGSSEAYGNSFNVSTLPIIENVALEPLSTYGATKAAADIMLRQMTELGLNVIIFRPFNHSGPGQSTDYVIPTFASQIAKIEANLQEPVINVGNLEARRDFLNVKDVVKAYMLALVRPDMQPGKRYNISTSDPISIKHILDYYLTITNLDISVHVDKGRFINSPIPVATGDFSALRHACGWSPKITIEETLQSVLNYERDKYRLI